VLRTRCLRPRCETRTALSLVRRTLIQRGGFNPRVAGKSPRWRERPPDDPSADRARREGLEVTSLARWSSGRAAFDPGVRRVPPVSRPEDAHSARWFQPLASPARDW